MFSDFRINSAHMLITLVLFVIEPISVKTLEISTGLRLDTSHEMNKIININCNGHCKYPGAVDTLYVITITGSYRTATIEYDIENEERDYEIYYESSVSSVEVQVHVIPTIFFTSPSMKTWTKKIRVNDYPFSRTFTVKLGNRSDESTTIKLQVKKLESSNLSSNINLLLIMIMIMIIATIIFSVYKCYVKVKPRETINFQMARYVFQPIIHAPNYANNPLPFINQHLLAFQPNPIPAIPIPSTTVSHPVDTIEELFPEIDFEKIREPFSQDRCSICLENFNAGETCRQLYCKHIFHSNCIKEWLLPQLQRKNKASCPNCHQHFVKETEGYHKL